MNAAATPPVALAKSLVFIFGLIPALLLWWNFRHDLLGADPIAAAQQESGRWALNFLLLTLCVSPLRTLTQLHWLLRLRRMLGLFAFFYAALHLWTFAGLDHAFRAYAMLRAIDRQTLIIAGPVALVLLLPLAATSNHYAIARLGGRRWQELHRAIYPAALLACLHFLGMRELAELPLPLSYSVFLGILLWWRIQERRRKAQPPAQSVTKPVHFYRQERK